jgi:hypothetical protein
MLVTLTRGECFPALPLAQPTRITVPIFNNRSCRLSKIVSVPRPDQLRASSGPPTLRTLHNMLFFAPCGLARAFLCSHQIRTTKRLHLAKLPCGWVRLVPISEPRTWTILHGWTGSLPRRAQGAIGAPMTQLQIGARLSLVFPPLILHSFHCASISSPVSETIQFIVS